MESLIRRHRERRRARHGSAGSVDVKPLVVSAVPVTQDHITQLLDNVEVALSQENGDVLMSEDVQNHASHLGKHLDKVTIGVQISKDVLDALGTLQWVGTALTIVAMGLDMSLKMHDNKEQCSYLMKQYLDIWKRYMKPMLKNEGPATDRMAESMDLIIEGYLFCKKLSNSGALTRFIRANNYEQEIEALKKKLEFFLLKEIAVSTIPLRRSLCPTASLPPIKAVALKDRTRDVVRLLKLEETEETRVVVLHGMGGVGKSVLANAVFDQIAVLRGWHCCSVKLGEKPSKDHIVTLQRQMVNSLTGQNLMTETDSEVIKNQLRQVLSTKTGDPVFIYIDDVFQPKDLEECIPLDCELITLPKGSRWLVTTRDESVCTRIFRHNQGFEVKEFKVNPLKDRDAQKLFCLHAFGLEEPRSEVMEEYDDGQGLIGKMVTSICGNLPLALRVLGRSLYGMNVHTWRKKYDGLKNHGELERLEEQITNVLKSSYDTLDGETQTAFLMACVCFHDMPYFYFKEIVESILPQVNILRLFELGLLERESSPVLDTMYVVIKVKAHDVVRNLGYQMAVARKCAPTIMPTCKQDFVNDDEIWSEVKWLRVPPLEDGIDAEFIEKCKELQVVVLEAQVNGEIGNPPLQLKVIYSSALTSSLLFNFDKLEKLVYVNVVDPIEDFSVVAPSARRLQVFRAFGGTKISEEAIDLHKNTLRKLTCKGSTELTSDFCHKMIKLQSLYLRDFHGTSLPEEMGSFSRLEELSIRSNTIEELPQSLRHLRQLQYLSLLLGGLKEFPSGVLQAMKELAYLQLRLKRVTSMPIQDLGQLASLESMVLSLPSMARLVGQDGMSLMELKKLKYLHLDCGSISSLEGVQFSFPSLECLLLILGKVEELPLGFISGCTKLQNVALISCLSLRGLSADMEILSGIESWYVGNCPELMAIPEGVMKTVGSLVVVECPSMQGLPRDVDEEKAGSMRFLACDTHIIPHQFMHLPSVLALSPDDWRADQQVSSFFFETFQPVSIFGW